MGDHNADPKTPKNAIFIIENTKIVSLILGKPVYRGYYVLQGEPNLQRASGHDVDKKVPLGLH